MLNRPLPRSRENWVQILPRRCPRAGCSCSSLAPVSKKYAWPKWDDTFEDPLTGKFWTFRQIVQGLIDNFLGRDSEWRWRLNDDVPIPKTPTR